MRKIFGRKILYQKDQFFSVRALSYFVIMIIPDFRKLIGLYLILCFATISDLCGQRINLNSPDGSIAFSFSTRKGIPEYQVTYKKHLLIRNSQLGLVFRGGYDLAKNVKVGKPIFRSGVEDYELPVGKVKKVTEQFREVTIPLGLESNAKKINLVVRAFSDGVAFRYEYPIQPDWSEYILEEESSAFNLMGDPIIRALFLPGYTTSHEGEYHVMPLSRVSNDTLIDMPALFEFPGKIFLSITEAALRDYAGMYLKLRNGVLTGILSPLPGEDGVKVKAKLPHRSPWRVMMISDRIGALIESNILTNLNESSKLEDHSWLRPGMSTFPWWNGNIIPDTSIAPGNNFETNKYYIDFCARNGLEYHSVVEYGQHEWYTNDGANFMPGPNADVTRPVPGLNMKEVCDYANQLGVGIRVWVHWAALYPKLDSAFSLFERWGIKGMMVDFMDRDDQQMVNIQEEILQKAARHKLHIQFHGAYKPTGMHRTYPNEFTREGTLNYEANKWSQRVGPAHDINIPFTRMLAGSTDYHLGGFRSVPDSLFKIQYIKPLMLGTRCHMLGMYIVLENYQGMLCDYPAAYEGQPGFDFLKAVPTVWDETRVPAAEPGKYITIARRNNREWFIGSITNDEARTINIPMSFLGSGSFSAEIYNDGNDKHNPNVVIIERKEIKSSDTLQIKMSSGGGHAVRLIPNSK